MNVLLPQWVTIGAPGASASSTSKTAGSSSRSRRTFATASQAAASVSARIATIGLALEADAVLGEDELLLRLDADEPEDRVRVVRDVRGGQRADEPGHALRLGQVDALDPGVVERAADHLEVEHPGERPVGREDRPAGDVADAVAAVDRLADDVQCRGHRVGAPARVVLAAAAASIARTIGW